MKILFAMTLPYEPALGGANKANRCLAEILAERGYNVRVLAPAALSPGTTLEPKGRDEVQTLIMQRVTVHIVRSTIVGFARYVSSQLVTFGPDRIVLSSEDPLHLLLQEAVRFDAAKVIYLAHTPNCLPFGPASFSPTPHGESLLGRVGSIVSVSRFCSNYITTWSQLVPAHVYLPVYGCPPFPRYGSRLSQFVTMVNPCAYKGISIFKELAVSLPSVPFAAVPSWGTTGADVEELSRLANVTLLEANPDIDQILKHTRILLAPSLYLENFPMIIIEAMLRGIPVVASNVGGIPEAKLGTGYIIPVCPIASYLKDWDEKKLWIPIVPAQDISPWVAAVSEIYHDEMTYSIASAEAANAAHGFVASLGIEPLENLLRTMPSERRPSRG